MKQHSRSKPQDGASDCIKGPPRPALQPRRLMSLLSGLVLALLFAWPGPRQPGRGSATSVHPITTPSELSVTAFLIYARPEDQIAEVEDHARPSHREGARGPRQACRRRDLPALAAIVAEQVQVRVPRQKLHWLTLHPRRHRQTAFRVQKARARTPRRLKQGCYQQVLHHLCPSMHPRHQQLLLRRLVLPRLFQRWSPQALRCQTRPPLLWTAPSRLWLQLHQLPRLQCLRQLCLDPPCHLVLPRPVLPYPRRPHQCNTISKLWQRRIRQFTRQLRKRDLQQPTLPTMSCRDGPLRSPSSLILESVLSGYAGTACGSDVCLPSVAERMQHDGTKSDLLAATDRNTLFCWSGTHADFLSTAQAYMVLPIQQIQQSGARAWRRTVRYTCIACLCIRTTGCDDSDAGSSGRAPAARHYVTDSDCLYQRIACCCHAWSHWATLSVSLTQLSCLQESSNCRSWSDERWWTGNRSYQELWSGQFFCSMPQRLRDDAQEAPEEEMIEVAVEPEEPTLLLGPLSAGSEAKITGGHHAHLLGAHVLILPSPDAHSRNVRLLVGSRAQKKRTFTIDIRNLEACPGSRALADDGITPRLRWQLYPPPLTIFSAKFLLGWMSLPIGSTCCA